MKRNTHTTATTIEYSLSLVIDRDGSVRMTRGSAALSRGERELRLQLSCPKAIFETPVLSATIKIDDADFSAKVEEVRRVAANALTSAFPLVLTIEGPKT